MPLDYRLISQLPAPRLDTFQQIQGFGQAAEEDRNIQRDKIAQQVIQETLSKNIDNPDAVPRALRQRGMFGHADKFEQHLNQQKSETLKRRGLELDLLVKQGQLDKAKADAEKAAAAAADPMEALPFIALADSQEELQTGRDLIKFKFGEKADALLAQLPSTWSPDVKKQLSNMLLGPKGVAEIENQKADNQRAQEAAEQAKHTAAMTAANQLRDDERATATAAETARHNKAMEAIAQGNLAARVAADKAAAASGAGGAKLSATAIDKVAAADQALLMVADIESILPQMKNAIGPLDSWTTWAKLKTGGDVTGPLADFDTQLASLKNAVIKAATGAQMSEPEAQRIGNQVPSWGLPDKVFESRLKITKKNIDFLRKRIIELSGGSVDSPTDAPKKLTAEELIKKYGGG